MPSFQELHGLQLSGIGNARGFYHGLTTSCGMGSASCRDDVQPKNTSHQVLVLENAAVVKATLDQPSAAFAPESVLWPGVKPVKVGKNHVAMLAAA